ncbi:pantoate--beta-alanine ligase [Pontibacter aydingkolensis]|uniref:Pantothenate synthetase n=1 Tax=Pontibacter aydingkolensis TaxID=1911536 RepID=A0ABS7CR32_9BACT|nr:pantoate--beta-alanine ligase [Pontibacter aydingkolensis]MBW7466238.1 pantoate--beta-alanine ligase [Pontibacter aydingkolensis]
MEVIKQVSTIREKMQALRCSGKRIGFVPTMGALHEGHLQLLRASARENDITVCSIFVNPTQFNNPNDYKLYPRTSEQDIRLLQSVNCDYLFLPDAQEVYTQQSLLKFSFGELETVMEGEHRPGHFNGVATIVSKLFHYTLPHKAYFGQKDLQQVAIVRQLVQALSFDLELVCYPTVREESGLAMSSRNERLSSEQRQIAADLYKALKMAAAMLPEKPVQSVKKEVADYLKSRDQIELEYFEVADPATLQPVQDVKNAKEVALCLAAQVGPVRLIDNLLVNLNEE